MAYSVASSEAAQTQALSEKVVSEVADVTDSDPISLRPLYEVIDTDALNALFESTSSRDDRLSGRIEFAYCGCTVVAYSDGTVSVSDTTEEVPGTAI